MKFIKLTIYSLLLLTLIACNNSDQTDDHQNKIITSIYPIEYIVSEITGDYVDVDTVTPPGSDAHSYEPSTKRMLELSKSDGFFFIGAGMESFSETMAKTIKNEGVHLLRLAEYSTLFEEFNENDSEHNDTAHDEHNDFDPHFWLDPNRMIGAGEIILQELITLYPEKEQEFKANFEQFKNKMTSLDQQYKNSFNNEVIILVTHKSFSYLEERYPIKQLSIRGVSSSQEPSQKELQKLFNEIQKLNINYIVLESNSKDRLALTIADELNLEKFYLNNLSTRTDEEINQEKTYYDIMLENLDVLKEINKRKE